MDPDREVLGLPPARTNAMALMHDQVALTGPQEDARRFVAIVSQERTVIGALKCDRCGFTSVYFVAKIINGSDEPLCCNVAGRTKDRTLSLPPGEFWIDPQSVAHVPIRVPWRFPRRIRTIALEVHNSQMRASADADVPPPRILRFAKFLGAVAVGALVLAGTWQMLRPKILGFALPERVAAGGVATASYTVSGIGTVRYDVANPRGVEVASGFLDRRAGTFSFPVSGRDTYEVLLSVTGPLGMTREALDVTSVPFAVVRSAAVQAIQADPSIVRTGDKIDVHYVAQADRGTVTLFDASGIPLAHGPYNQRGETSFPAPSVNAPTQYRIAIDVSRGPTSAQASTGLLVLPKANATPTPLPVPHVLAAGDVFRIEPNYLRSAKPFVIHLLSHPRSLHLVLEDGIGQQVADVWVKPQQQNVRLSAPYVDHDSQLVLVASFDRGNAQQMVLQQLVVHRSPGE